MRIFSERMSLIVTKILKCVPPPIGYIDIFWVISTVDICRYLSMVVAFFKGILTHFTFLLPQDARVGRFQHILANFQEKKWKMVKNDIVLTQDLQVVASESSPWAIYLRKSREEATSSALDLHYIAHMNNLSWFCNGTQHKRYSGTIWRRNNVWTLRLTYDKTFLPSHTRWDGISQLIST